MITVLDKYIFKQITLQPGEFHFDQGKVRINTLLGSCVAITLWHPNKHLGGMCHYMLPKSSHARRLEQGFFADGAMKLFLDAIKQHHTRPEDYHVKLFGGSNMFRQLNSNHHFLNVAEKNIAAGLKLLKQHGFHIQNMDLGGTVHRQVYLELWNGDVWVKYGGLEPNRETL
ncbi:chemoreceptor glutamine deamidase CheD [Shewanella sp. SR44-3]|uniref:chemoreceptor glutamine deamidase CheD n=1 Tax=unclassified Shewanella TaxID=196818 RepID=UPI0015FE0AFC|nr:chemoreceptor glutamine deamidase CheD [Shewanella sp. SR44-3]MBB1268338.1 chemoreceptor glutamine deamidase CheD [Shewanella sp. SR44-3]